MYPVGDGDDEDAEEARILQAMENLKKSRRRAVPDKSSDEDDDSASGKTSDFSRQFRCFSLFDVLA